MVTKTDFNGNYVFDPIRYFDFVNYMHKEDNILLCWGINLFENHIKDDTKINVYLDFESPNGVFHRYLNNKIINCLENYDYLLTICPFFVNYVNSISTYKKAWLIPFPIPNFSLKNNCKEKKNDIFYTGNSVHGLIPFEIINKFMKTAYPENLQKKYPTYMDKLEIMSETKIALVHCNLRSDIPNMNDIKDEIVLKNFEFIYNNPDSIPQLKSRVFEAALCKCIIMCYRDDYQIITKYFKENEDFIFFSSYEELYDIVGKILQNYESYAFIAENAYKKTIENYTTQKIYENIISKLK